MVHCRPLTTHQRPEPLSVFSVTVRVEPRGTAGEPYLLVPFDVPLGTRAVRVAISYPSPPRAAEEVVIDLGLLAPASADDSVGFRGYSGGERTLVVVGERTATPGYRPGPITPGTWHALVGRYRIPPDGIGITLHTEALAIEPEIPGGVVAQLPRPDSRSALASSPVPAPSNARWIPVDLHSHTLHSDGAETPAQLAQRARARGIEALFVTDHNTDAHLPDLAQIDEPVLLPGEEVTTYRGHLNALGISSWIDFRFASAEGIAGAIEEVHRQGGIVSVNHPASDGDPWLHGVDLDLDAIEVWNGPWSPEDDEALAWWDGLVASGRRVAAVGGSDTHGPGVGEQPVGTPTTWIFASSPMLGEVVSALRAGRVVLTRDPTTAPPVLWAETAGRRADVGETLAVASRSDGGDPVARWRLPFTDVAGSQPAPANGWRVRIVADGEPVHDAPAGAGEGSWTCARDTTRVRIEVRTADGELVAATNHVHLERSGQ